MESINRSIYLPAYLALVFHISGYIGMQSSLREWFLVATPLTLLLMAGMIIATTTNRTMSFWKYVILCFATGVIVEWIGVNTSLLFGHYAYGQTLGPKVFGVPLMIGVQWFVTVWSMGHIAIYFSNLFAINPSSSWLNKIILIIFGAFMTTCFDYVLEPAAISLGYWQWFPDNTVPVLNYICWFLVSGLLLIPFFYSENVRGDKHPFAMILALIQLIFFIFAR